MKNALSEVSELLKNITSDSNTVTPTLLYNEGWLLRLVLHEAASGTDCMPFRFEPDSRWFSEVLLPSAFKARFRGDQFAETSTSADAAVGHFTFDLTTKAGVRINSACGQLVVCEAKIFSGLSEGTRRAPNFDQGARTVACMAEAISRSGQVPNSFRSLGFFVLAPLAQIDAGVFAQQVARAGILEKISERIAMYRGEPQFPAFECWRENWVLPLVERLGRYGDSIPIPGETRGWTESNRLCFLEIVQGRTSRPSRLFQLLPETHRKAFQNILSTDLPEDCLQRLPSIKHHSCDWAILEASGENIRTQRQPSEVARRRKTCVSCCF